jgi:hypothetical protein
MSLLSFLADLIFVGHSLVGPNLPPMVEGGLRLKGMEITVAAQVINGAPLAYQWDNGGAAEGIDARVRLAQGQTDILVLTEAQPLANHVQWSRSSQMVAQWAGAAWDANPKAQVFLYETWPSLASGPGTVIPDDAGAAVPWRQRLDEDWPVWLSLTDAANAARPEGAPEVQVIPAGQAMARLSDAIAAGQVPGLTAVRDLYDDDIHLNGRGLYFVALVHIAAITGQSPEGLPPRFTRHWINRAATVPADMAAAMQRIAWDAVIEARTRQHLRPAAAPPEPEPAPAETAAPEPPPPDAAPAPDPAALAAARAPAADIAALPPVTNPALGLNLAGVNDWSVQQPFLNVMKTARPWLGHKAGQWGGWDTALLVAGGHVDARGYPVSIPADATGLSTLVLTDLPDDARHAAGRYLLTWSGKADLRVEGRVAQMDVAPNRIAFDFTPGPGSVILTVTRLDPADPLRDLVLVRQDRAAALAAGDVFNPDWTARLRGVRLLRFMDWMATNDSTLARAADRPRETDFTWAARGVPMEVMVRLANDLGADPWFCMPHLAEDALVREMAQIARDGLDPALKAHVELSNEVWNWQFAQAKWAEAGAIARWGKDAPWVQFYALRAVEVAGLWTEVFGAEAPARLVRVISSQTGWPGLEEQILDAPLIVAEGAPPPREAFDAYAVTAYFSALLGLPDKTDTLRSWLADSLAAAEREAAAQGLTGTARADHIAAHRFDLATARAAEELEAGLVTGQTDDTLATLLSVTLPHHARAAEAAGLDLMLYEAGTHVVGTGPLVDDAELSAFFRHLNYSPQMGDLYARLLAGWAALSPAPFAAFNDVQTPSKWGSWGALRHLGDDNPRWRALAAGCSGC